MTKLILAPLQRAIARFQEIWEKYQVKTKEAEDYTIYRDALMVRFNFTYELSFKTLKRFLKEQAGINEPYANDVFRQAGNIGLIESVENWLEYKEHRNLTIHTYREEQAEETVALCKCFLADVQFLFAKLQQGLK